MEILSSFFYQLLFTVGIIVAFGLIIALCRRAFCNIVGRNGPRILLATGAIGTPIHELSHALMCIVFGHKIEEIKLYQPDSNDGTLGYVSHSFNPKNLYHQIGNFFIGVAPIICGSGFLLLFMYLLVPDVFTKVMKELEYIGALPTDSFDWNTLGKLFESFGDVVTKIFDFSHAGEFVWWLFLVVALMISSHMELSGADIKGGFKGFLYIAGILLVADIVVFLISPSALQDMTAAMTSFSMPIAGFLAVSGVFSLLMLLIALVIKGIMRIFKR